MKLRAGLAALAIAAAVCAPRADAQVLPPPPPIPAPPPELQPLLELLAPVGGNVTEGGCAALGTVLGLGTIVIPGLPGTIESATGLPLSQLPIALQPELATFVNTLLYVQGSGCGLLPLAAERTVCATDDDLAAAYLQARGQVVTPGTPIQPADLMPPAPVFIGAIVDTFHVLADLGIAGAADVATALDNAGDCEPRSRFTNIEPPPVPPNPVAPTPSPPTPEPAIAPPHSPPVVASRPIPAAPATSTAPRSTAAPTQPSSTTLPLPDNVPQWLQLLAVAMLIAFLYRAAAPRGRHVRPG